MGEPEKRPKHLAEQLLITWVFLEAEVPPNHPKFTIYSNNFNKPAFFWGYPILINHKLATMDDQPFCDKQLQRTCPQQS